MRYSLVVLKVVGFIFILISHFGVGYAIPSCPNRPIFATDSVNTKGEKEHQLKEAKVIGTRFLLVVKKDTTIYDLDALTLKNGALLREAFEKLPGICFRNGSLYHNGQEVKRVLINGMDFSSKNPLLALQTLPSYIMKNIKVYERKSDFSEKTGIDDGQQELVADVSVRRKYMGVWTGQLTVGVGDRKSVV